MAGDVIREFLISIGFHVDPSINRIPGQLDGITDKVFKLATGVDAAALAFEVGIAKMADSLEKLYFVSQRTGSTAANIQALGFAGAQMGSSVDAVRGSLENLASFIRSNPGAMALLNSMGVSTRNANGTNRDTATIFRELSNVLRNMPFYRAQAYANVLGIDTKTLMAMREGLGGFASEYLDMVNKVHLNLTQATKDAHGFMVQLRTLGAALEVLGQSVAAQLFQGLGANIQRLRVELVDNFDQIEAVVLRVAKALLFVADSTVTLVIRAVQFIERLVDSYNDLDTQSQNIVKTFGIILVAWRSLSVGILSTPLGRMFALITAMLLLLDDYEVWKKGGKSAINWGELKGFTDVYKTLGDVKGVVSEIDYYLNHILDVTQQWGRDLGGNIMRALAHIILAYDQITGAKTPQWVMDILTAGSTAENNTRGGSNIAGGNNTDGNPDPGMPGYDDAATKQLESPHPPSFFERNFRVGQLDRARQFFNFFRRQGGLPDAAAAGLLGNAMQESGLDPTANNGSHGGILQWDATRRAQILAGTGIDVWNAPFAQQLTAALWEMKHGDAGAQQAYGTLQANPNITAGQAAVVVSNDLERPGNDGSLMDRVYFARNALGVQRYMDQQAAGIRPGSSAPAGMGSEDRSAGVTINSAPVITITGVSDPKRVGDHVHDAIKRTNNDLVRNLKGNSR